MTTNEYNQISDEFQAIGALLAVSAKMSGTQTWDGLVQAAQYLAMAKENMNELQERIERLIGTDND